MRHGIQFFIRVYFYDCNVFVAMANDGEVHIDFVTRKRSSEKNSSWRGRTADLAINSRTL